MTTLTAFYTALKTLSVTGVTTSYNYPPLSLNSVALPAKWAELPAPAEEIAAMTFKSNGGWPLLKGRLVIAVSPVGQDVQDQNYADTLTMADALNTAFSGATVSTFSKGPLEWTVTVAIISIANVDYWAVISEVTGHG